MTINRPREPQHSTEHVIPKPWRFCVGPQAVHGLLNTPSRCNILQCFGVRFADSLVVLPNLMLHLLICGRRAFLEPVLGSLQAGGCCRARRMVRTAVRVSLEQATSHHLSVAMLQMVMRGLPPGIISVLCQRAARAMHVAPCSWMTAASWR